MADFEKLERDGIVDSFQYAADHASPDCPKCKGSGTFMYDSNYFTMCDLCCTHPLGWWELTEHYGKDNGKWCCLAGCGKTIDKPPEGEG